MKMLISENQFEMLLPEISKEVDDMGRSHSDDRINGRINEFNSPLDVVIASRKYNTSLSPKIAGTYLMPQNVKDDIKDRIKHMMTYTLPKDKSYAVVIYKLDLHRSNELMYTNRNIESQAKNEIVFNDARLCIKDKTGSFGDTFIAIVRGDVLKSLYFTQSWALFPEKHRVDEVIKSIYDLSDHEVKK
jgi:hypothetical protein